MDLSFNRKSIFRKSFRQRHPSSTIPPAAVHLMKSLKKNQSTRRLSLSLKMSSKLLSLRRNSTNEKETRSKPGNSCRSSTQSNKLISSHNDDEDQLLLKSPILKRQHSVSKLLGTPSKWMASSSPIKRNVSKVVAAMERTIWDTPKKQVSKLFRRGSYAPLNARAGGCSMELCGSYKVLVFE